MQTYYSKGAEEKDIKIKDLISNVKTFISPELKVFWTDPKNHELIPVKEFFEVLYKGASRITKFIS